MGRKIPGKKHRGVKDPEIQRAARDHKLKEKVNAPPVNPLEQEVPKSLLRIMKLKDVAKNHKFKTKRKKNKAGIMGNKKGLGRLDKRIPSVKQLAGETDESYLKRVDEAMDSVIGELQFESQFNVKVKRNQSGEIEDIEKAEDKYFEELRNQKKQPSKKQKVNKIGNNGEAINSKERRKMKNIAKKELKKAEQNEKLSFRDHVKFGEVVHRPPQFTVKPRHAETKKVGSKNTLLLQNFFPQGQGKLGKNINMSLQAKQRQEELRSNVVQLYRIAKANKNSVSV